MSVSSFLYSTTTLLSVSLIIQSPSARAFSIPRSYGGTFPTTDKHADDSGHGDVEPNRRTSGRGGRTVVLRSSLSEDFDTGYEWLERRHARPVSKYIRWMDPLENTCLPPPSRQMGFDIDGDTEGENVGDDGVDGRNEDEIRLPIYPLSAVYLPSSAVQTLHNVQTKNVRMARDLKAGKWKLPPAAVGNDDDDNDDNDGYGCFVATLQAKDTGRISTVGTLMRVVSLDENYTPDGQTLLRIVVRCRAVGVVRLRAVEEPRGGDEYRIGRVRPVPDSADHDHPTEHPVVSRIHADYDAVRSTYASPTNGVAARELPPYARTALLDNLPPFSPSDFARPSSFWNVAETWQILCNTVREARRSDLRCELNEVMVRAACEKGGPLVLPVKRGQLSEEVRGFLERMERDAEEEFLSLGMDPCLDFLALLGMSLEDEDVDGGERDVVHVRRLLFLGDMIGKEKDRLEAKEKLKAMFRRTEDRDRDEDEVGGDIGIGGSFFQ